MTRGSLILVLTAITLMQAAVAGPPGAEIVDIRKIWDRAPHNAFTDLIRFKGEWFCVFREGKAHVSPDGSLRVLTSRDGQNWTSAALITAPDADLRDAKISITPDERLMLSGAGALHQPAAHRHQSMAWFSTDGRKWSDGVPIGDPDYWLWRTTWWRGAGYGIGYSTNPDRPVRDARLYSTRDGAHYQTMVQRLDVDQSPSEHALVFLKDGTCVCLLRRDAGAFTALMGTARPPYAEWKWTDLGQRIGGPHLLQLPDGRIVAGVRLHDGKVRTGLCWLDPGAGTLTEFLSLPSGGDTSYPGLVWHKGLLWVSYYSSHEGKTSIYLARVKLPPADAHGR